jgi:hypothetical protein
MWQRTRSKTGLEFDSQSSADDEIESALGRLLESGRFDHYASHSQELRSEIRKRFEQLTVRVEPQRAGLGLLTRHDRSA